MKAALAAVEGLAQVTSAPGPLVTDISQALATLDATGQSGAAASFQVQRVEWFVSPTADPQSADMALRSTTGQAGAAAAEAASDPAQSNAARFEVVFLHGVLGDATQTATTPTMLNERDALAQANAVVAALARVPGARAQAVRLPVDLSPTARISSETANSASGHRLVVRVVRAITLRPVTIQPGTTRPSLSSAAAPKEPA
jgi:hypothetical protein